jgi:hypothetical protein
MIVVMVAVYAVEEDKLLAGVKVAIGELYVTLPLTSVAVADSTKVNEDVLAEAGTTSSVNSAEMAAFKETSVPPGEGFVEVTLGGVLSLPAYVMVTVPMFVSWLAITVISVLSPCQSVLPATLPSHTIRMPVPTGTFDIVP